MRTLVTGAGGMLGSGLVPELVRAGHDVVATDIRVDDAAPFVLRNPIPNSTPDLFDSLAFPRLLLLRSTVLKKQGQAAKAEADLKLFVTLSERPGATR